jgi:predicted nucleic acid-binding Zn ribbon protein
MDQDVLLDRYEILKKRKRRQNITTLIVGLVFLLIMLIWIGPILLRR